LRVAVASPATTSVALTADVSLANCIAGDLRRPATAGPLTIDGQGHTITQTCPNVRVVEDDGGTLTLENLTITGGSLHALGEARGGGIDAEGNLSLDHVTVTGNTATGVLGGRGGGGYVAGNATVTSSTVSGNTAAGGRLIFAGLGGGLLVAGDLKMTDSTVDGNTAGGAVDAGGRGGGFVADGSTTVTASTVSSNTAAAGSTRGSGFFGGAAVNSAFELTNSTISGNRADGNHGAVGGLSGAGRMQLVYDTVTGNSAATRGANVAWGPAATSFATVVAEAQGGAHDCAGRVAKSDGYNFSDDSSCGFTSTSGDRQSAGSPQLRSLADNGGPTKTRRPSSGSPLIGAVPSGSCSAGPAAGVTTDQRGDKRSDSGDCTIGAVEIAAKNGDFPTWLIVVLLLLAVVVVAAVVTVVVRRRRSA
jgi:hypothetical protein